MLRRQPRGRTGLCQNFRDFEFRGDPNVYINREIQEVPVCLSCVCENLKKKNLALPKSACKLWSISANIFKADSIYLENFDIIIPSVKLEKLFNWLVMSNIKPDRQVIGQFLEFLFPSWYHITNDLIQIGKFFQSKSLAIWKNWFSVCKDITLRVTWEMFFHPIS